MSLLWVCGDVCEESARKANGFGESSNCSFVEHAGGLKKQRQWCFWRTGCSSLGFAVAPRWAPGCVLGSVGQLCGAGPWGQRAGRLPRSCSARQTLRVSPACSWVQSLARSFPSGWEERPRCRSLCPVPRARALGRFPPSHARGGDVR